jgi:hypothetical protein
MKVSILGALGKLGRFMVAQAHARIVISGMPLSD